jgi:hypothetical protein
MKNKIHRIIERSLKSRIKQKPGEEDFWLVSIYWDDPGIPTAYEGLCVTGKYKTVIELTASIIAEKGAETKMAKCVRYDAYQGESARRFRAESIRREIRYQQERAGQPNN